MLTQYAFWWKSNRWEFLKEKLPQAFMQIGWMEDDFRKLTAKVWANLDNPIKRYDFSKGLINFVYVALSGGTLLIYVMSQQYNCLMELYTNFYKILPFMKMYLPSSFILRYVRADMNEHAFTNELYQTDYWYPRKIWKFKNLCSKSMESCPLVISHILAEFHPERATYTTFHNHFLNGLPKSAQTFTVGFLKLLSSHPIYIVVWGNFPFKDFWPLNYQYSKLSLTNVYEFKLKG